MFGRNTSETSDAAKHLWFGSILFSGKPQRIEANKKMERCGEGMRPEQGGKKTKKKKERRKEQVIRLRGF